MFNVRRRQRSAYRPRQSFNRPVRSRRRVVRRPVVRRRRSGRSGRR